MNLKNVLIVEDTDADQFLSKKTIKSFDETINIYQAHDGQEALAIIASLGDVQLDVIFLDINMPVMNGIEFLEHYSKKNAQSAVVVMLTSSDQLKDREQCNAFDCVKGYLIKPLETKDLEHISKMQFDQLSN